MQCINHPHKKAVGRCSECGSFICEVCNSSEEDNSLMCETCAMLSTFAAMTRRKHEVKEKRTQKESDESVKRGKKRKSIGLVIVAAALLVSAAEIVWYHNISKPEVEKYNPSENIFSAATLINEAIIKYREDHDGEVPDSLDSLPGIYLPESDLWKRSLWDFNYQKISSYKYELMPPIRDDKNIPGLIFSDEGVKVLGMD